MWRVGQEIRVRAHGVLLGRTRQGRGRLTLDRILPSPIAASVVSTRRRVQLLAPWAEAVEATRRAPESVSEVVRRADLARGRAMELFGDERVLADTPPRWNVDPYTGRIWPSGYHRSIDYVNAGSPSDVKRVWELSRLRHLVHLAQAVAVVDDHGALSVLEADLENWHAENPVGWSVNWTSSMEVALRAVNLICVHGILGAAGSRLASEERLIASLYQHGWFLSRNLEISDVNGNHFLANAVGLVWLGRYFGDIGEAPRWLDRGYQMVHEAARGQVLADGLDHEGSLPYHLLVLEMFLFARVAAGAELATLDPTLRMMVDATVALIRPDGLIPDLGDDDGGRVGAFSTVASRDARRVLALAGGLLGHPEAHELAADRHRDDALWLLGRRALDGPALDQSDGHRPKRRWFPSSGLVVLGKGRDHVVVDLGAVGFRGRGGHGHLDAMSFEAVLDGEDAVRDSGTGSYTGNPGLRNELRDARAHTLVVIGDRPYARVGGPGRLWSVDGDATPTLRELEVSGERHHLVAVQDLRLDAFHASYERRIEWSDGRLAWSDTVDAAAGVPIESLVQLPDGCEVIDGQLQKDGLFYHWSGPIDATIALDSCRRSDRYDSVRPGLRARVRWISPGSLSTVSWRVERG